VIPLLLGDGFEQPVELAKAVFGDEAVAIDPCRQALEGGRIEVDWPPLRVARAGDQAGGFQDVDVLGNGLLGDSEGFGELVDGGVAARESGDHRAADGIGEGHEGEVEREVLLTFGSCPTIWLINHQVDKDCTPRRRACQAASHNCSRLLALMPIARVVASLHRLPVQVPLLAASRRVVAVVVRVETDAGAIGYGVAGPQHAAAVVDLLNRELGPYLVGHDPLLAEHIAHALEQRFNPRAMSGLISCALSGVDIALWDLRGKLLGQPVWKLLGGYSASVAAYITFGVPEYDTDQLVEAARLAVGRGYRRLKMVVGLDNDLDRVRRVREAIGADIQLMVDANEGLDLLQATALARQLSAFDIAWFEEPLRGNDVAGLAELRRRVAIPVAAGQFEGHRFRLRDLMLGGGVDVVQTNVLYVGGYTEALKVAHMADALRLPIAVGGGWAEHNAHLMAAVSNSHGVEMHAWQWTLAATLYEQVPTASEGVLTLGDAPGLGLDPRPEVLAETLG